MRNSTFSGPRMPKFIVALSLVQFDQRSGRDLLRVSVAWWPTMSDDNDHW